jgi:hypothetical protein
MAMVVVFHSGLQCLRLPLGGRVAARVEVLLALTALRMMLKVGELELRVTRTVPWTMWPSLRAKLSGMTVMVLGVWVTLMGEGRA